MIPENIYSTTAVQDILNNTSVSLMEWLYWPVHLALLALLVAVYVHKRHRIIVFLLLWEVLWQINAVLAGSSLRYWLSDRFGWPISHRDFFWFYAFGNLACALSYIALALAVATGFHQLIKMRRKDTEPPSSGDAANSAAPEK